MRELSWLTACLPPAVFFFFVFLPLEPSFVGSAYIQESLPQGNPVGDDDKIYFFFSEAGKEFDFFDNTIVSRIARVCKVSRTSGSRERRGGGGGGGQRCLPPLSSSAPPSQPPRHGRLLLDIQSVESWCNCTHLRLLGLECSAVIGLRVDGVHSHQR